MHPQSRSLHPARAALEDGGTDERSRSEGTLSENAWPRAKTADGGRKQSDGLGHGLQALEEAAGGLEAGDSEDLDAATEYDHRRHAHHGVVGD